MRLSLAVILAAIVCACGGSESSGGPAAPSAPPLQPRPSLFQLSGVVLDRAMRPIADALVEVVDGREAGRSTISNASGAFSFTGNFVSTETIRVSKAGYLTETRPYTSGVHFLLAMVTPSVNLDGNYTLTMEADPSCLGLPEAMRTRSYAVTIAGYGMVSGATFFNGYHEFGTYIAGDYVRLEFDLDGSPWLVENPAPNTYLAFRGAATALVGVPVSTIATAFEGLIDYCAMESAMGAFYSCSAGPRVLHVSCSSKSHRLTLTPR